MAGVRESDKNRDCGAMGAVSTKAVGSEAKRKFFRNTKRRSEAVLDFVVA